MAQQQRKQNNAALNKDDVRSVVRETLKEYAFTSATTPTKWWNSPIFSLIVTALSSALIAFCVSIWQGNAAHNSEDLRRDIALEVSKQVDPIKTDIGRIKQELSIISKGPAQVVVPFSKQFPKIKAEFEAASKAGIIPPMKTIESVRASLINASDKTAPDYWEVVLYVVNSRFHYALADKSALHPGVGIHGRARHVDITNEVVNIGSDTTVTDSVFTNCIIKISAAGPPNFQNVRFVACAFVFEVVAHPSDKTRKLSETLLATSNPKDISLNTPPV